MFRLKRMYNNINVYYIFYFLSLLFMWLVVFGSKQSIVQETIWFGILTISWFLVFLNCLR